MKYVLYIEYRANEGKSSEYVDMKAQNAFEAVAEADRIYNPQTMYLIRIMERFGRVGKVDATSIRDYEAVLCKRSLTDGWHENISANSESEHRVRRFCFKDVVWYGEKTWGVKH